MGFLPSGFLSRFGGKNLVTLAQYIVQVRGRDSFQRVGSFFVLLMESSDKY
jgi:hypothetical protein